MTFPESLAVLHDDRRNIAILDIATTFAIMAGAIWIFARYPGPWAYALAFVVIGLMQYRIVIACHEAVHKRLLFPLWLNEGVGAAHCILIGINLYWYRRQHLAHHAAQDVGHDADAYIYEPILRARPGVRRLTIWILGTAGEIVEKIRQKGFTVSATIDAEGNARLHSLAIVALQAVLLFSCTIWFSWWYYFAFWLAPLLTIALFMNRTRVLVEHGYGHVPRKDGSDLREARIQTIDLSVGLLERFFIAPYRFNYHSTHHQVPSIPYYKNPDLLRLLEQHGKTGSVQRPSYAQALRHVLWN
jgi:fatty acid desaturase